MRRAAPRGGVAAAGACCSRIGGVLWSNALAYRDVNLAPRDQLAELETIGERIAGQGPTLMTEYQPYGVRHFLRDGRPRGGLGASPPPDPAARRRASSARGDYADTDELAARRRCSPTGRWCCAARRPRAARRRPTGWSGAASYYEVWQRPAPATRVACIAHLGLGDGLDPDRRAALRRRAPPGARGRPGRRAGRGARRPPTVVPLERTRPPGRLGRAGDGRTRLLPRGAGRSRPACGSRATGAYDVWLGGSVAAGWTCRVDGRAVGVGPPPAQQLGRVRVAGRRSRLVAGRAPR